MENIRLQDIAEALNLSIATVSNVLRGKDNKVSPATKARVKATVEEMGYLPERAEVLMARNPSHLIGLVINDHTQYEGSPIEDPYIARFISCLQKSAQAHQLDLLVRPVTTWQQAQEFASIWNMKGLVITGFCEADYISLRKALHIPLAVCDSLNPPMGFSSVVSEDHKGGYLIGKHLKNLGHEKIVCLTTNMVSTDFERIKGMKEAGLNVRLLMLNEKREKRKRQMMDYDFSKVSAAACLSDQYALELLSVLYQRKIRVPQDLSVCGYDGIPASAYTSPPLTTLVQDIEKKADLAVSSLFEKPDLYSTDVKLIVRNSTGVPHEKR